MLYAQYLKTFLLVTKFDTEVDPKKKIILIDFSGFFLHFLKVKVKLLVSITCVVHLISGYVVKSQNHANCSSSSKVLSTQYLNTSLLDI